MKTFRRIITLLILSSMTQFSIGQNFQVPQNYTFKNDSDYAKYEKDVVSCVNWLEKTPINQQQQKRKEASTFFMKWVAGTNDFTVQINYFIVDFTKKNPSLLTTFMGGWAKFAIQNPQLKDDSIKGNVAGLKSVIKVYKMGNGIKPDDNVTQLIALNDKGLLEKWVRQKSEESVEAKKKQKG